MYVCTYVFMSDSLSKPLILPQSGIWPHRHMFWCKGNNSTEYRNEFLKMKKRFKKKKAQNDLVKMHQLQGNHKWCFPLVKFACNCASQVSVKNPIPAHNLLVESSTVKSLF